MRKEVSLNVYSMVFTSRYGKQQYILYQFTHVLEETVAAVCIMLLLLMSLVCAPRVIIISSFSPQDAEAEDGKQEKKKGAKKCKNLERRSTRNRKSISYRWSWCATELKPDNLPCSNHIWDLFIYLFIIPRFDDFDEAIDEAIEEDVQNSDGGGGEMYAEGKERMPVCSLLFE